MNTNVGNLILINVYFSTKLFNNFELLILYSIVNLKNIFFNNMYTY